MIILSYLVRTQTGRCTFFIVGWGHNHFKDHGPAVHNKCENCNNENFWHLCKSSTWFTFFFIPIFPYQNDRLLICPVCQYGLKLSKEQFDELLPLADANKQLAEGKITEAEHQQLLAQHQSHKIMNSKYD